MSSLLSPYSAEILAYRKLMVASKKINVTFSLSCSL
jgi:hypothetical protein